MIRHLTAPILGALLLAAPALAVPEYESVEKALEAVRSGKISEGKLIKIKRVQITSPPVEWGWDAPVDGAAWHSTKAQDEGTAVLANARTHVRLGVEAEVSVATAAARFPSEKSLPEAPDKAAAALVLQYEALQRALGRGTDGKHAVQRVAHDDEHGDETPGQQRWARIHLHCEKV